MNYITPQEAAEKWGVGLRRVQFFCANGKVPGTVRIGRQWMIPADAKRPEDGRTVNARRSAVVGPYHFPVFVYSEYYSSRAGLSEDELTLLDAQLLNLSGDYSESIFLCRKLIGEDKPASVRFGAYCTMLYDNMTLGLYSEMQLCLEHMEVVCASDALHREDYRFLIAACKYMYSLDPCELHAVDLRQLSDSALITYELITVVSSIFSNVAESGNALRVFAASARRLESEGVLPALLVMDAALALLSARAGSTEVHRYYVEDACRIGYEEGFHALMAKYSSMFSGEYYECLRRYGAEYARKIEKIHQNDLKGWEIIFRASRGEPIILSHSLEENELLLLLSYGMTVKAIAKLKDITVGSVNALVKSLCRQYGFETKAELVKFAKKLITVAPAAENPSDE